MPHGSMNLGGLGVGGLGDGALGDAGADVGKEVGVSSCLCVAESAGVRGLDDGGAGGALGEKRILFSLEIQ